LINFDKTSKITHDINGSQVKGQIIEISRQLFYHLLIEL